MLTYMHYTGLATDQSNEIDDTLFWCYFDPHGNTTRMSNDPRVIKKEKKITPVTIAPAKASFRKINRKVEHRYRHWLRVQNTRKYCLKILEVIPEGEEKAYNFQEQQEEAAAAVAAAVAEIERWEKEKSEERQRQLQEKYRRLKQDRDQQQQQQRRRKQKQQKKNKYMMMMMMMIL